MGDLGASENIGQSGGEVGEAEAESGGEQLGRFQASRMVERFGELAAGEACRPFRDGQEGWPPDAAGEQAGEFGVADGVRGGGVNGSGESCLGEAEV